MRTVMKVSSGELTQLHPFVLEDESLQIHVAFTEDDGQSIVAGTPRLLFRFTPEGLFTELVELDYTDGTTTPLQGIFEGFEEIARRVHYAHVDLPNNRGRTRNNAGTE